MKKSVIIGGLLIAGLSCSATAFATLIPSTLPNQLIVEIKDDGPGYPEPEEESTDEEVATNESPTVMIAKWVTQITCTCTDENEQPSCCTEEEVWVPDHPGQNL